MVNVLVNDRHVGVKIVAELGETFGHIAKASDSRGAHAPRRLTPPAFRSSL